MQNVMTPNEIRNVADMATDATERATWCALAAAMSFGGFVDREANTMAEEFLARRGALTDADLLAATELARDTFAGFAADLRKDLLDAERSVWAD
jgi:hypothetical protein